MLAREDRPGRYVHHGSLVSATEEQAMPITVSWPTLIASGSSRATTAGAEAAPGGTDAGRYVNLVSCQMPGAAAPADSGQRTNSSRRALVPAGCR